MAAGAARARLGEHVQFDEAGGSAIADGGDHVGFRHLETAANDAIRALPTAEQLVQEPVQLSWLTAGIMAWKAY